MQDCPRVLSSRLDPPHDPRSGTSSESARRPQHRPDALALGGLALLAWIVLACGGGSSGSEDGSSPTTPAEPLYAYQLDFGGLAVYRVAEDSGALVPRGRLGALTLFPVPRGSIGVAPDAKALYLVSGDSENRIDRYVIDPATGQPLPETRLQSPVSADPGAEVDRFLLHPSGRFLIAELDVGELQTLRIDSATGALSLGPSVPAPTSTGRSFFSADGSRLYFLRSGLSLRVYRVASDGTLTQLDAAPEDAGTMERSLPTSATRGLVESPSNGDLLVPLSAASPTLERYGVDASTGAVTFIETLTPSLPALDSTALPAVADPLGRALYVLGSDSTLATLRIDASTGDLEEVDYDALTPGIQPFDLAPLEIPPGAVARIDPAGRRLYLIGQEGLDRRGRSLRIALDPATGETFLPAGERQLSEFAGSPRQVLDLVFAARAPGSARGPRFVVGQDDDELVTYAVDATTGALTERSRLSIGGTPAGRSVIVEPLQRSAYVATQSGMRFFRIDPETGTLSDETATTSPVLPSSIFGSALGLDFDPSGRVAAVVDANPPRALDILLRETDGDLFDVPASPFPAPSGYAVSGAADNLARVHPNTQRIYWLGLVDTGGNERALAVYDRGFTIDLWSELAIVDDLPFPVMRDLLVDPLGRFLVGVEVSSSGPDTLLVYALELPDDLPRAGTDNPAAIPVGDVAPGAPILAAEPSGRFLYVRSGDEIRGFEFDRSGSGFVSEIPNPSPGGLPGVFELAEGVATGLVVGPSGQLLFARLEGGGVEALRIDPDTGALASLGLATSAALDALDVIGSF